MIVQFIDNGRYGRDPMMIVQFIDNGRYGRDPMMIVQFIDNGRYGRDPTMIVQFIDNGRYGCGSFQLMHPSHLITLPHPSIEQCMNTTYHT